MVTKLLESLVEGHLRVMLTLVPLIQFFFEIQFKDLVLKLRVTMATIQNSRWS